MGVYCFDDFLWSLLVEYVWCTWGGLWWDGFNLLLVGMCCYVLTVCACEFLFVRVEFVIAGSELCIYWLEVWGELVGF